MMIILELLKMAMLTFGRLLKKLILMMIILEFNFFSCLLMMMIILELSIMVTVSHLERKACSSLLRGQSCDM